MSKLPLIVALALALALPVAAPARHQDLPTTFRIQPDGEGFVLACDEGGASLIDVLRAFSRQLDLPFAYWPEEVQNCRLFLEGTLPVAKDDLQTTLVALLNRVDFECWGDTQAGATLVWVYRRGLTRPGRPVPPSFAPRVVGVQDLFGGKVDLEPLCTVVFRMEHARARDLVVVFNDLLDTTREAVRVTEANQVVVTAHPRRLREIARLASELDVAPQPEPPPDALAAFEARLAALETRVEQLEQHPGR